MQDIILNPEEIEVLKKPWDNLDKTNILRSLQEYWFIIWVDSDNRWFLLAKKTIEWEQFLRKLERAKNKSVLSDSEITINAWPISIKKKIT